MVQPVSLLLIAGFLASTLVAGCLAPERGGLADDQVDPMSLLSAPVHDRIERLHIQVPGHDGKLQDTWVFKPKSDDPEARFPVFINFSPYWSNAAPPAADGGDAFSQHMIDHFVPRGYAIVLASVRGTGHSEGCFPIGGVKELEDAYAVIDHYANAPWSNGHIASGGKSYDGTTIQGVAGYKPHPALKLVFPVSGISDMYRYSYRGGVPYDHGARFNEYYYQGVGMNGYAGPAAMIDQGVIPLVDDVACPDLPFVQAHGAATSVHGLYNDYWNERDYNRYADQVDTAFFFVHGFQDWNVKPDHILPWLQNLPEGSVAKAYLHQWQVCNESLCPGGHVYPMRDDWNLTMLRAMDHFLKGIDTGLLDEPAFHVQDSSGTWRTEAQWPPADVTVTDLHPGPDGILWPGQEQAGTIESDGAPLTFRFAVEETLHSAGAPVFEARLATADPYGYWTAQLWLEENDTRTWMNEGLLRGYLRDDRETPSPVVPGEPYDHHITFYPQDDVFPAGSTLVLTIGNSGSRFAAQDGPSVPFALDTSESRLVLPTIDPSNQTHEDPQPNPMFCFACL